MVISKGSYGHGESKNVLPYSVQIPYLPVRGRKLPRLMGGSIAPRMEICETSTLPSPIIPRLYQSKGYIKRKLRAWRVQKCIALVCADTIPVRGRKLRRVKGGGIGSRMEICETSTLPSPMVPHLHQSHGYIKRKLQAWRVQKCISLVGADTLLTSAGPQTTSLHGV